MKKIFEISKIENIDNLNALSIALNAKEFYDIVPYFNYFACLILSPATLALGYWILRKLNVVIATIMASIFLKEKHLLKKIGILTIMLIGVALPIIF